MLLNHRYRILKDLSEGSFGKTYLAEDTQMPTAQRCVIKQLKPVNDDRPGVVQLVKERFAREAAVLESVGRGHRQIPDLLAYFEIAGQFYLVQEWIEGTPLNELVQSPWPEAAVAKFVASALGVIAHIHSHNIIHRDLKPENIILRQSDRLPCLIDFGAVKEPMQAVVTPTASQAPSVVIGTLGFMAPEQAVGRPVFSSDLYSLAMTAIYLLTARVPLEMPSDSLNGRLLWRQFAPTVSDRFAGILTRAINPNPTIRYASAPEMLSVLEASAPDVSTDLAATPPFAPQPSSFRSASPVTQLTSPATQIGSTNTQITPASTQLGSTGQFSSHAIDASNVQPSGNQLSGSQLPKTEVSSSATTATATAITPAKTSEKTITRQPLPTLPAKQLAIAVGSLWLGVIIIIGGGVLLFTRGGSSVSPERLQARVTKLENKVESRPGNIAAQLELVEAYTDVGDYESALLQVDQMLSEDANNPEALNAQGNIYLYQGAYADAIATFNQSIEQSTDQPAVQAKALNFRGRAYQETGDYDKALDDFQQALETDTKTGVPLVNQANVAWTQGERAEALSQMNASESLLSETTLMSMLLQRGNLQDEMGDAAAAQADWERVSNQTPKDAEGYTIRGFAQLQLGDTDAASEAIDYALSLNPNLPDAHTINAIIAISQQNRAQSDDSLEKALAVNPNFVVALQSKGALAVAQAEPDYGTAIEQYSKALTVNPNNPNVLRDRCDVYLKTSENAKALTDCEQSIAINPHNPLSYNLRGQAHFFQDNFAASEQDFTRVIELNEENNNTEENHTFYFLRAGVRGEQKNTEGAIADLDSAIALKDDEPDYYKLRGLIHFVNGDTTAAGDDLKKAKDLYEAQGKEDNISDIQPILEQLGLL
ncbi:MAG: tetratricopeptide repeat protein [Cyanobacteria bacterium J06643_4]